MSDSQNSTARSVMPRPDEGSFRRQVLQRAGVVLGALAMPAHARWRP